MTNEQPQAWIIVANRSNMERVAQQGVFGLSHKGPMAKVKVGDRLVAYIRGEKVFAGLGTVTEPYYLDDQPIFDGGLYPDRIGVTLEVRPLEQSKDICYFIDDLTFPSNPTRWQASLVGGIRQIPYEDFRVFERQFI